MEVVLDTATLDDYKWFLNKSCIIYGRSGSGKSHIIKHILYLLRAHVPTTIAFSMSEKNNSNYSRAMIPRCLVLDNVTREAVHSIAQRQNRARLIYERAHNTDILRDLFVRVATQKQQDQADQLRATYDEIATKYTISDALDAQYKTSLCNLYGSVIDRAQFDEADLSDDELFAIKWHNFNPNITVVFDDCSTDLAKLKGCADVLEQIFQGRHYFCTSIIALHNESMVLPAMRSNVGLSLFTDQQTARQWAMRPTNGFQKSKRDILVQYADRVCVTPPHTKMVYRDDAPYLVSIPTHTDFSAVSQSVRDFCASVARNDQRSATTESWMRELAK